MFKKFVYLLMCAVFSSALLTAAEQPAQPAEKKAQPAEKKAQPAEKKAQPAEKKAQPAEKKAQPAEKKAQPAEKKAQPAEKKAQPAEKKAQPAVKKAPTDPTKDLLLDEKAYASLRDFLMALYMVKESYGDKEKATYDYLLRAALRGMLHELDPYSNYESAEMFRETQEDNQGEKAGVGVVLTLRNRALEVVELYPGGPAEKAGIKPGDLIMEINGQGLNGKKMQDCIKMLRGRQGEQVKLKVYRGFDDTTRTFLLTRKLLVLQTVVGAKIIDKDNGIAYLRLTQFGGKSTEELDAVLKRLESENMKALIIDLRNNPGGLVVAAAKIASRFLTPGKSIVTLEDRERKVKQAYKSEACKNFPELPIALLVNGNSASASELLSACLQDYKRAVVIGEQSFGKGVVQTVVPFGKKEALRITTAKYYTPSHRAIHGVGIKPDIHVPLTIAKRHMISAQMNQFPGVIKPNAPNTIEDVQLARAQEILKAVNRFRENNKEPGSTTEKKQDQKQDNNKK